MHNIKQELWSQEYGTLGQVTACKEVIICLLHNKKYKMGMLRQLHLETAVYTDAPPENRN